MLNSISDNFVVLVYFYLRELRRQLFGRYRRRRSRSRSMSPYRHGHGDRSRSGHGYGGGRDDDRSRRNVDKERRARSRSPRRRGRSTSPAGSRRDRSPVRENSEERRAKIEQWNREREKAETGNNDVSHDVIDNHAKDLADNGEDYFGHPNQ